ncbi:hypothetical protein [Allocatelliglobosispora scoriae]|uniref:hypothetical protein n=1 Tax=Allocatelliglobosispora scoriae TaxID=643052 RepID=UPI001C872B7E
MIDTLPAPEEPVQIKISPDGGSAYVIDDYENKLFRIDIAAGQVTNSVRPTRPTTPPRPPPPSTMPWAAPPSAPPAATSSPAPRATT